MRSVEFEAKLDPGANLKVPDEFAAQIGTDQPHHVILMVPDSDDDPDWRRLTADQFLRTYADSDSIYDKV